MRQKLRHQQQPVAAQTDAQDAGLGEREEVRGVREDVREHAGAVDARAHAQLEPQVRDVRESVLAPLAPAGPPALTYGR